MTNFEQKYRSEAEPWEYSARAAEGLRHDWVVAQAKKHLQPGEAMLDAGCSLGQLTGRFVSAGFNVCALDISPTAVAKTRSRLANLELSRTQQEPRVEVGNGQSLPFADASFAVLTFCDGLEGWELSPEQKITALREADRVLVPGGTAILTDYLHPRCFESHIALLRTGPLELAEIHYLNDRLWFQINTNFKFLQRSAWGRKFLSAKQAARAMARISSLFGPAGSKHIAIILRKRVSGPAHRGRLV